MPSTLPVPFWVQGETLIITTLANRDSFTVASEGEPQAWSPLARSAFGGYSR